MTLLQRIALWFAVRVGLFPAITSDLVEEAKKRVTHGQLFMKFEASEYRRHVALKALIDRGATPRQAALAIEVAVSLTK